MLIRSVLAICAGFGTMVAIVTAGTFALVATMTPGGFAAMRDPALRSSFTPKPSYLAANLSLSLIAAIAGGLVTLRLAPNAPTFHLVALGSVIGVMGIVSAFSSGATIQPRWYRFVIPLVGIVGIAVSPFVYPG